MKQKACPYCLTSTGPGECPGCHAQVSAGELVAADGAEDVLSQWTLGAAAGTGPVMPAPPLVPTSVTDAIARVADGLSGPQALKIGVALYAGVGVEKAPELAYKLFTQAVRAGCDDGWYFLGVCNERGEGVLKDDEKAKYYYAQGAEVLDKRCVNALKLSYGTVLTGGCGSGIFLGVPFTEMVDKLFTNVVRVAADTGQGTGWGAGGIVTGNYIVTNAHVVLDGQGRPYERLTVYAGNNGTGYAVKAWKYNAHEDVAVLTFEGAVPSSEYGERLWMRASADVKAGEDVFTIGNPLALGLNVTRGTVSRAQERDEMGRRVLRTDMTINHGNSGGPLLDMGGNLLGLMTFSRHDGEHRADGMSWAVTSDTIKEIING